MPPLLGRSWMGEPKLVLSLSAVRRAAAHAETGPIFHQTECARYDSNALPQWFAFMDHAAIRGYGADGWIRYETGRIVRGIELTKAVSEILENENVAFVHIRSKFGYSFQCRVDRT